MNATDLFIQKGSDVNDLSTSTPVKHIKTTLRSTEVQVSEELMKTTENTEELLVNICYFVTPANSLFFSTNDYRNDQIEYR